MSQTSRSVCCCHLCPVRCLAPCVAVPCLWGENSHSWGHRSEILTHAGMQKGTHMNILLTAPMVHLHCPSGQVGLERMRGTQQWPPQSLLSCPVLSCLLCSLLSALCKTENGRTLTKLFKGQRKTDQRTNCRCLEDVFDQSKSLFKGQTSYFRAIKPINI